MAKVWNQRIFSLIEQKAQEASRVLAQERGPYLDTERAGVMECFSYKTAVAPTASISIFCGGVSPGIEPIITNAYTHKKSSGSFLIKKPKLVVCLEEKGMNTSDI